MAGILFKSLAAVTVTTSGTKVAVSATPIAAVKLWVSSRNANTGNMYVGDTNVSTTRGVEVIKGTTQEFADPNGGLLDLGSIYIDAGTNGDKAFIAYLKPANG